MQHNKLLAELIDTKWIVFTQQKHYTHILYLVADADADVICYAPNLRIFAVAHRPHVPFLSFDGSTVTVYICVTCSLSETLLSQVGHLRQYFLLFLRWVTPERES